MVSVINSNAAAATVSPASITFTSCSDTPAITVTPVAPGSTTVSLSQVSNTTGGTFNLAPATFTVTVSAAPPTNSPPTVSANNATVTVSEGATATNTGTYSDTNGGDSVAISASVGTVTKTGTNSGTWSWSFGTTDGPSQSRTVTITANDGTTSSQTTLTLTVNNVPPAVSLNCSPAALNEGGSTSCTYTFTDPGADTWTHTADCGGGTLSLDVFMPASAKSGSFTCAFPDDNPTGTASDPYTVSLTVNDDDTGTDTETFSVTVSNVAPVLGALTCSPASISEGGSTTCSASFTDVGTNDTHSCSFNWGDGSGAQTVTPAGGTCSASHTYVDDNATDSYSVSLTVTDDDTGADTETSSVTVTNLPPVLTLTPGASLLLPQPQPFTVTIGAAPGSGVNLGAALPTSALPMPTLAQ